MVDRDEPYTLSMAVVAAAISCNLSLVVQAVVPLLPLPPPSPELVELPPELQVLHLEEEEEEEEHQLLPLPLLQHPLADLEDKSLSTVTTTTSTTTTHAPILTSFKTGTSAQSLSILNQATQGFPPIHPIHLTPPTPHTPHPIPQLVSEDLLPLHHLLHLLVPESLTEFSAPEDSDLEEVPCLVAALALSAIVVGMIKLITPKPLAVVTITDVRFFFIVILLKKLYIQN